MNADHRKTYPKNIYLVSEDDYDYIPGDVLWCEDKINNEHDVAYVRAALAGRDPDKVQAVINAAQAVVKRADLNDKGDFIVSEKRFDALEAALKGVPDGK